jgi:hypothetical protein
VCNSHPRAECAPGLQSHLITTTPTRAQLALAMLLLFLCLHDQLIKISKIGRVEEGVEGSPLNFLVSNNVMGKVPIIGRNNGHFSHNDLRHQKI